MLLNITAAISVNESTELHSRAMDLALEGGLQRHAAEDLLGTAGDPDIAACLRLVVGRSALAPGVETLNVVVEAAGR